MEFKTLISKEDVQKYVKKVAGEINKVYTKDDVVDVICVLNGAFLFCADLVRELDANTRIHFVKVKSYGDELKSSGKFHEVQIDLKDLDNKNVLIVEDIVDSGRSLKFLVEQIKKQFSPKTIKTVPFLNKKCARVVDFEPDFYGVEIGDKFIVGYGLDYKGEYRQLDYIAYVE